MKALAPTPTLAPGAAQCWMRADFDPRVVRAISIDLDDTLWPIGPTIVGAEAALQAWLGEYAPAAARLSEQPGVRTRLRQAVQARCPERLHDLSYLRQASIEALLREAGEDPTLAPSAFAVFFAARQQVTLFDDALPALQRLAARYPVCTLSNGNADVHRVGIGQCFVGTVTAKDLGVAKPDVRVFAAACQTLGCEPPAVLHVGDDLQLDAVGALRAGVPCAWVHRGADPAAALADWPSDEAQPQVVVRDLLALCAVLGV
jgi:FMN hydrolase / 5-amino-6-(5-phospho-D-ribitylamino)uracil phosphatase